jgi:hypothetical protein
MDGLTFSCPVCGADVPRRAKACPECGACEKSGWSEDRYLDGVDLPEEDFRYGMVRRTDLGGGAKKTVVQWFWWFVAVVVVIALAWVTLQGMFR